VSVSGYVRSGNKSAASQENIIRRNYSQLETISVCIFNAEFDCLYENVRLRCWF